ncbi:TIGR04222 domain-containing membrane protein [Streptomyces sp. rh34]|uniref:TIGR04222 domain-containing membrane protein n=1 Tax=Streptomyces sp. rh34 TaxID=2034272 RepID=UPI0015CF5A39|nr:TIGR04222 domain-containing membrane protein [Streptomyces sp. rh34]
MNVLALAATLAVVVSSVLLVVKAVAVRAHRPPAHVGLTLHHLYEAAFLNGGPARVADTALTSLQSNGRILIGGPGIVSVRWAEPHDPVEHAVLQELSAAPSGALHVVREAVMRHPAVQEIGDGLAARGLLVPPHRTRPVRRWALVQSSVCLGALPLSLLLTFVQYAVHDGSTDFPVPFIVKMLPAVLIGGLCGLVVAASVRSRITRAGRHAAGAFRTAYASVMTPAHVMATVGPRGLADPGLQAQLAAAARMSAPRHRRAPAGAAGSGAADAAVLTTVWCAASTPGGSGCGGSSGGGSGCSSGSGCGGGGGSSCGGGSSSGGSSCGGGSGGSSCGGGGGS